MPKRSGSANDQLRRGSSSSAETVRASGFVEPWSSPPARRPLAVSIWSALLIADIVLIARRVSGEMPLSLPAAPALLSMFVVAFASFAAWLAFRNESPYERNSQTAGWIPLTVSLLTPALWCVTLATQATPLVIGLLVGAFSLHVLAVLSMVGTESFTGVLRPLARIVDAEAMEPPPQQAPADSVTVDSLESPASADGLADECDEEPIDDEFSSSESTLDDSVTQWISRRVTDDGELVEGWLRVDFPAGQREAIAHVSFCPPLAGPPEIETEDLDGTDLEIRVGTSFPFGARLTARRGGATGQPSSCRIGFVAIVARRKAA